LALRTLQTHADIANNRDDDDVINYYEGYLRALQDVAIVLGAEHSEAEQQQ
jgi:hypothetical protein